MTRIFDALKKAEAARQAATPLPPRPAAPVPFSRGAEPARAGVPRSALPLLGGAEVDDVVVRAMSTLRVSVEGTLAARAPRTLMFLAPQGGEGTSTIALQFAQVLARDPAARPLLMDAHARRPAYGVSEDGRCAMADRGVVAGRADALAVVSNLFVVPVPDPIRQAGMMQPATLRDAIDANAPGFDWIVLDAPPVLDSPDAAALSALADGVILVLQAGRTKRPVMTRAAELLTKSGATLLGTVLNRRVLEIPEFIYRRI
jgi:Mrp family chromosome partitioning ATPase